MITLLAWASDRAKDDGELGNYRMCIYMSPSLAQRGVEEFITGGYGFRGVLVSLHSTLMTTDILGIVPRPKLFPRSLTVYARTRAIGITSAATA